MPKTPEEEVVGVPNVGPGERPSKKREVRAALDQGALMVIEFAPDRENMPPSHPMEGGEADENDIYTDDDVETALSHFRNHREQLERDHFNQYVTIDIVTGQMAVAANGIESVEAYEKRFGPSKTLTMHIGTTV